MAVPGGVFSSGRSGRAGRRPDDSLQAEPYLILGQAYAHLSQLEAMALAENGIPWNRSLRYYEAVAALVRLFGCGPMRLKPGVCCSNCIDKPKWMLH